MKKNNTTTYIIIAFISVLAIGGFAFFYFRKKKTQNVNGAVDGVNSAVGLGASQGSQPATQPVQQDCVPYTNAQRDAERQRLRANCSAMFLIPFIGPQKMAACLSGVDSKLQPVKTCP